MKTLTIRDETYQKLVKLKRDNESFSDVIERIIEGRRVSIEEFVGTLKNSEILKELEDEWLQFRRKIKIRG
jgi:predicted CopG family antitoxin